MSPAEMLARAEVCERRAAAIGHPVQRTFLRQAAQQWRELAQQMEMLQQEPIYHRLRKREPPKET